MEILIQLILFHKQFRLRLIQNTTPVLSMPNNSMSTPDAVGGGGLIKNVQSEI
jgi:hypothetical protein